MQFNASRGFALRIGAAVAAVLLSLPASASECGQASWYRMGTITASGEPMDAGGMTAAHRTLPFGTKVQVENLANERTIVVRINDRGPFIGGRIIDVTEGAAKRLGMVQSGVATVRVTILDGDSRSARRGACTG